MQIQYELKPWSKNCWGSLGGETKARCFNSIDGQLLLTINRQEQKNISQVLPIHLTIAVNCFAIFSGYWQPGKWNIYSIPKGKNLWIFINIAASRSTENFYKLT